MSPYPIPCVNRSSSPSSAAEQQRHKKILRHDGHNEPRLIDVDSDEPQTQPDAQISSTSERGEDDWVSDINQLLRFNASFAGRGLLGGTTTDEGPSE